MVIELGFSFPGSENQKENMISYKIIFAHKIKALDLLKRSKVLLTSQI